VEKFKQGIAIDSSRHDTKWCLGNAYTSQVLLRQLMCCGFTPVEQVHKQTHSIRFLPAGMYAPLAVHHFICPAAPTHTLTSFVPPQGFLTADSDKAQEFFTLATGCFGDALQADPGNEVYRKALDMTKKAPELHAELQRQLAAQGEVSR